MVLGKIAAAALVASLPGGWVAGVTGVTAVVSLVGERMKLKAKRNKEKDFKTTGAVNDVKANGKTSSAIEWAALNCKLEKKGETRSILRDAGGAAKPGRMLAIMGPSGSGKTTLLTALAGIMPKSKNITLSGVVAGSDQKCAFVPQEDVFYSQLTVRETLRMAASFQLPEAMTKEQKEKRVDEVIKALSLAKCADTVIGDKKTRGISGGEKKRLSIGIELLSDPAVIFADEPTTGLDSFQAEKVVKVLQELAKAGRTVICTIHQPKASTFALFDDIVLLSDGLTIYGGSIDEAKGHFSEAGFACPDSTPLAEFMIDLVSVNYDSAEEEQECRNRLSSLHQAYSSSSSLSKAEKRKGSRRAIPKARSNWWTQVKLLYLRSFRQVFRDKATNMIRITTNINSALVFGCIYWRLRRSQSTIQDRCGLLQVSAINTAMSSVTKTLTAFSREKIIVDRERTKGNYTIGPYLIAKLAAELPISAVFPVLFGSIVYPMCGLNKRLSSFLKFLGLISVESFASSSIGLSVGSLAGSPESALALGPAVMVIFIVFGGYYVKTVPKAFRWIQNVSLIRHGFEGLSVNEFQGLKFDTELPSDVATGQAALERLGFGESTVSKSLAGLGRIMLFNYLFTYAVLKDKKPSFQQIE